MISRSSMRRQYGIEGNACSDCLISCFCGCCAAVQEDKEVKAHLKEDEHSMPGRQPPMIYTQPQQRYEHMS